MRSVPPSPGDAGALTSTPSCGFLQFAARAFPSAWGRTGTWSCTLPGASRGHSLRSQLRGGREKRQCETQHTLSCTGSGSGLGTASPYGSHVRSGARARRQSRYPSDNLASFSKNSSRSVVMVAGLTASKSTFAAIQHDPGEEHGIIHPTPSTYLAQGHKSAWSLAFRRDKAQGRNYPGQCTIADIQH